MSPLTIPPANSPPLPNWTNPLNPLGRLHSLCGRATTVPGFQGSSGGPAGPLELARSDSISFAGLQLPWRATVWSRGRLGSFPYVDSTTQYTPQWSFGMTLPSEIGAGLL